MKPDALPRFRANVAVYQALSSPGSAQEMDARELAAEHIADDAPEILALLDALQAQLRADLDRTRNQLTEAYKTLRVWTPCPNDEEPIVSIEAQLRALAERYGA